MRGGKVTASVRKMLRTLVAKVKSHFRWLFFQPRSFTLPFTSNTPYFSASKEKLICKPLPPKGR
jgi:hypothetical protein